MLTLSDLTYEEVVFQITTKHMTPELRASEAPLANNTEYPARWSSSRD